MHNNILTSSPRAENSRDSLPLVHTNRLVTYYKQRSLHLTALLFDCNTPRRKAQCAPTNPAKSKQVLETKILNNLIIFKGKFLRYFSLLRFPSSPCIITAFLN